MTVVHNAARFPLFLSYGSSGGPGFATEVAEAAGGWTQRNGLWSRPLWRWDAGSALKSAEDLQVLRRFHRLRHGRLYGFRMRDPLDFSTARWVGQHLPPPTPVDQPLVSLGGDPETFQCVLRHAADGYETDERITRPRAEDFLCALDGAAVDPEDYALDDTTGRVVFAAPVGGAVATWGGTYDRPAAFLSDWLPISIDGFASGSAPEIGIEELRE